MPHGRNSTPARPEAAPAPAIREPRHETSRRELGFDALVLALLKLAIGALVLRAGFTHVSDDDYARTVIAEQFAHAPRLDPSATSWLPFPFWVEGAVMSAAGRSLDVARAVALGMGAICAAAPYLAMNAVGVPRAAALVSSGVALALPWNAWLGVATVPEGWAGALVAASVIAAPCAAAGPWVGAALLAASLSRYEAWPACAVVFAVAVARATRPSRRSRDVATAILAAAGPLAWMLWNRHTHGSALHFLARVSAFRHAIGAADVPVADKILGYPRDLARETPEVLGACLMGIAGAWVSRPLRARWRIPVAAALAIFAFLIVGDLRDGAPTHHPARALVALWWVSLGAGVDGAFAVGAMACARRRWPRWVLGAAVSVGAVAACSFLPARWSNAPGRAEGEQRDTQITRGLDLRARKVAEASIAPCAFEHFALLAAWGEPERAHVAPRTGAPPSERCPEVVER